jgi:hypothetical protein
MSKDSEIDDAEEASSFKTAPKPEEPKQKYDGAVSFLKADTWVDTRDILAKIAGKDKVEAARIKKEHDQVEIDRIATDAISRHRAQDVVPYPVLEDGYERAELHFQDPNSRWNAGVSRTRTELLTMPKGTKLPKYMTREQLKEAREHWPLEELKLLEEDGKGGLESWKEIVFKCERSAKGEHWAVTAKNERRDYSLPILPFFRDIDKGPKILESYPITDLPVIENMCLEITQPIGVDAQVSTTTSSTSSP